MTEWWTYRLSDFLMFAPRTYHRQFELANADWWPLQPWVLAAAAALSVALALQRRAAVPAAAAALVASWAFVGFDWQLQRFATINWPAAWFGVGFVVGAVLWAAALALRPAWRWRAPWPRRLGVGYAAAALVAHPAVGAVLGRPIGQAQLLGFAPDPTVLFTLAVLLQLAPATGAPRVARAVAIMLWVAPIMWCAIGGAMLWTMDAPEWPLLPLAGALAVAAARRERRALR